ncbi:hypothetical protein JGU66_11485 [Myxococcaceae bacterium JPH2]|nr:hypothetical protein [Myxococcaceae bacterium JPH2]
MDEQREWTLGTHRAWFEAPDILWARFNGPTDEECSRWSVGIYRELGERQRFYLAADIGSSMLSPESRKYLVEHSKARWFHAIVYIGAGLEQKAATKSLTVASMLNGNEPHDVHYADTAEQAREWIAAHRSRRAPQQKTG